MDKQLEQKLNNFVRQSEENKSLWYNLRNWIEIKNKPFGAKSAFACIYEYADGNTAVIKDILRQFRDNKKTRWAVLFIISFVMFAAYVASDNIFAVETTLQGDAYQISDSEYSSLAGAYSIFNVYLLMLIFGGIILDKKGIRFTGTMAAGLMVLGIGMLTFAMFRLRTLVAGGAVMETVNFLGDTLRPQVLIAVIGIGIYGVGAEIAGITAT